MLLLGIDLGTSSIKVSILDAANANVLVSATYPETEVPITVAAVGLGGAISGGLVGECAAGYPESAFEGRV